MKKNSIIYFTSLKIPTTKAHSIQILKMCEGFSKSFNTTLVCGKSNSNHNFKTKIILKNINFFTNKFLLFLQKIFLIFFFKRKKNFIYYTRDVHFAYILSLITNQKIFLELHYPFINKKTLSYFFIKKIVTLKNIRFVFISKSLKRIYQQKFKKFQKNFVIAHDASENFKSSEPKNKRIQVGYSGHLYKGRGIFLILELAKKLKNYDFNIAGGEKETLKYFIDKSKTLKNVKFYGNIAHNKMNSFFSKNHILIAPYEKKVTAGEGIETSRFMSPLKIFEYMSSKKPFISSNHKVLKEVLTHNYNALLCDPDNINQWIMSLKKLKSKSTRKRLSAQSYKDFEDKYSWDKRIEKILNQT